jgi:uncharacterized protein (DUF2235 family)
MARNLVICCDGTANEFTVDRTNELKLAFAVLKDQETQSITIRASARWRHPVWSQV